MTLWHLSAIATAIGAAQPAEDRAISGIHFDSRAVEPGDLFLAMPGDKMDGHAFITDAAQRGAVAAVVREANPAVAIPQLVVADVQAALVALGQAARARYLGPVVGVGGGVGKTTTTAFLAALLQAHAPVGSLNNHVGVPLTLARLPADAPAFVAEIGTNKVGEIAPLAQQVRPHVALITNVVAEHLEGLGNLENVRLEELSIVQGLAPNGVLVVPTDLEIAGSGWAGAVLRFNPAAPLPVGASLIEPTPARMACANAALAVLAALNMVPDAAALARLAAVAPPVGRGQVQTIGGVTLVDDSYNANPASVAAALQALQQRPANRRIVVLGDMRELGAEEIRYHTELAPLLVGVAGVVLLGPLMQHVLPLLPPAQVWGAYPNPDDFDPQSLVPRVQTGDAVLVKGSKSITYVRKVAQRVAQALQHMPN